MTRNQIDSEMTVNDVIRRYPGTITVFNEFGIDACCGGAASIDEAARRDGVEPRMLLTALRDAAVHGAGAQR